MIFKIEDGITYRSITHTDEPILQTMQLHFPHKLQFFVYSTIVASIGDVDDEIVGFTQFCLTPDGVLHSYGLNVASRHRGRGIAGTLCQVKEDLAIAAGAKYHLYAVAKNEHAIKKILLKQGMHL